ncbi:MAG TPA: ATP-binding protein [Candidatus Acidoferrales bacterium]|nr:ATP-binding protein [Candidatus Acidoferrales bacterium]
MMVDSGRILSDPDTGQAGDMGNSSLALQRVNEMLEEQSKRIAHAVHDEAGQLLAAVFIRLEQATRELPSSCGPCFQEIKQMLELIELQLREISHDLRPAVLDDLGLLPALQGLIDRVSKRSGIAINLANLAPERLPAGVETALYRFVQESLTNVAKHAGASRVEIRLLRGQDEVQCSVRDNGAGFDLTEVLSRKGSRGLGLVGIRERIASVGGTVSIHSISGVGTELLVTIPLGGEKCLLAS